MTRPWWITGVKFSCQTGCGKCCDEPGGIVYLSRHDAKRISSSMGMSVDDWLARDCKQTYDGRYILKSRKSDGICIYLSEDKTCNIYQNRPQLNLESAFSLPRGGGGPAGQKAVYS